LIAARAWAPDEKRAAFLELESAIRLLQALVLLNHKLDLFLMYFANKNAVFDAIKRRPRSITPPFQPKRQKATPTSPKHIRLNDPCVTCPVIL